MEKTYWKSVCQEQETPKNGTGARSRRDPSGYAPAIMSDEELEPFILILEGSNRASEDEAPALNDEALEERRGF